MTAGVSWSNSAAPDLPRSGATGLMPPSCVGLWVALADEGGGGSARAGGVGIAVWR